MEGAEVQPLTYVGPQNAAVLHTYGLKVPECWGVVGLSPKKSQLRMEEGLGGGLPVQMFRRDLLTESPCQRSQTAFWKLQSCWRSTAEMGCRSLQKGRTSGVQPENGCGDSECVQHTVTSDSGLRGKLLLFNAELNFISSPRDSWEWGLHCPALVHTPCFCDHSFP